MTRQFDPLKAGLKPEALEQLYNVVLAQKLVLEAKLERVVKELAVGACAIEDGLADLEQSRHGMLNLIAYIQVKVKIEDELDVEKGSLELIEKHKQWVKEYHENKGKN